MNNTNNNNNSKNNNSSRNKGASSESELFFSSSSSNDGPQAAVTLAGFRTPTRGSKRSRYSTHVDDAGLFGTFATEQNQEQGQDRDQGRRRTHGNSEEDGASSATAATATAAATAEGGGLTSSSAIAKELEDTKRLVRAFEAMDASMTEARDKLKTFYKTADETNTLLDMWIRVLSQTEHTQRLLQDPAWEGYTMEEERYREHQERRAAYHQAMEEANGSNSNSHSSSRRRSLGTSSNGSSTPSSAQISLASSTVPSVMNTITSNEGSGGNGHFLSGSTGKKSALIAAAHAHASAIAASRKRHGTGTEAGGGVR